MLYGHGVGERLTAQAWIDFGLRVLAREGSEGLKVDGLARKLGISRGSFYWHFRDPDTFYRQLIEHWKQTATEAIIVEIESQSAPEPRLKALLRQAFGHRGSLEVGMRHWAERNPAAAQAVRAVDARRCDYLKALLVQAGVASASATVRAQVLYWAYLGAALAGGRRSGESLDRIVTELVRLGVGDARGAPRPEVVPRSRRLR
jgi:AcrR family transcriptional regulator